MDLTNFDTPMLRDEYRKLQEAGLELMGSNATAQDFNALVEQELVARGREKTSRNWVRMAGEVLLDLSHAYHYNPDTDSYDVEV